VVNTCKARIGLKSWKLLLARRHIVRKSHSVYYYTGTVIQSAAAAITHRVRLHLAMFFFILSKKRDQNHHFFGLVQVQPVGLVDYESLKKSI